MKVKQLRNNVTEICKCGNDLVVLYSYETPVAYKVWVPQINQNNLYDYNYYKVDKFYSKTTSRHISDWLKNDNWSGVVDVVSEEEILNKIKEF
jgi:hypothetical protein